MLVSSENKKSHCPKEGIITGGQNLGAFSILLKIFFEGTFLEIKIVT